MLKPGNVRSRRETVKQGRRSRVGVKTGLGAVGGANQTQEKSWRLGD